MKSILEVIFIFFAAICVFIAMVFSCNFDIPKENGSSEVGTTNAMETEPTNETKNDEGNEPPEVIETTEATEPTEPTVPETSDDTFEPEEEYISVWTTSSVDVKKEPNTNSESIDKYFWNKELIVSYIDDNWAKIKDDNGYIERRFITEDKIGFSYKDAPKNTRKSYMDYRTITSKSSRQYKLQQIAYTGDDGIRMVNGRYCIALGSYYTTKIGQYVDIELENGVIIPCILADCKSDRHTDSLHQIHKDGSVVEFVVDTKLLPRLVKLMGDVSYMNEWKSQVVNVKVYDKIEKF